ncbi:hypothetical protein HDU87_003739 [Geranomyces variabilis]|uniref:Uncharacterized protein n=1 Tax=Geranomyces variabilis TaxID=109894 RepID=A0AAD5TPI3_9FUNG|nr:hypothetical protein HDU87_003739 [Geranomyces variabilis]
MTTAAGIMALWQYRLSQNPYTNSALMEAGGVWEMRQEIESHEQNHEPSRWSNAAQTAWAEELEEDEESSMAPEAALLDPGYLKAEEEISRAYLELALLVGDHKPPLPPPPPALPKAAAELSPKQPIATEKGAARKQRAASATSARAKQKETKKYFAALPSSRISSRPHSAVALNARISPYDPEAVTRILQEDDAQRKSLAVPATPVIMKIGAPQPGTKAWRAPGQESLPGSRATSARTRVRSRPSSALVGAAAAAGPLPRAQSARVQSSTTAAGMSGHRPQSGKPRVLGRPRTAGPQLSPTPVEQVADSSFRPARPRTAAATLDRQLMDRDSQPSRSQTRPKTAGPTVPRTQPSPHPLFSRTKHMQASHIEPGPEQSLLDSSFRDPYKILRDGNTVTTIPLDAFDDPEFETKTPWEWLDIGPTRGLPSTIAYSRYFRYTRETTYATWSWQRCSVLAYDAATSLYLIEWHPSGPQKLVKRLNLLFEDEDRERFYKRIEYAILQRARVLEDRKYADEVALAADETVPSLPRMFKKNIVTRVGRTIRADELLTVEKCMLDAEADFLFTMKRAQREFSNGTADAKLDSLTQKAHSWVRIAIEASCADDPHGQLLNHVAAATADLSAYMFHANTAVQPAIVAVLAALHQVLSESELFFRADFGLSLAFQTFVERVETNTGWVAARLAFDWPRRVCEVIHRTLGEVFNFHEKVKSVYYASRLSAFCRLVDSIMESQLTAVVQNGYINALKLFSIEVHYQEASMGDPRSCRVICPSTEQIPVLFTLQLAFVGSDGKTIGIGRSSPNPGAHVVLTPPFGTIEETLSGLLVLPASKTTGSISRIEARAMTSLYFDPAHLHSAIDQGLTADGWTAVLGVLRQSYTGINALVSEYAAYDFLLRESVEDILPTAPAQLDLDVLRAALTRYRAASKHIPHISLASVAHPPFNISCTHIQKVLEAKTHDAIALFTTHLSEQLAERCEDLTAAYKGLHGQIVADPGQDAVSLNVLQVAVDSCMAQVQYHNSQLDDLQALWQVLYDFEIPLSDEINELYWSTCAWPVKLEAEIGRATDRMVDAQQQIVSQLEIDREFVLSSLTAYIVEIQRLAQISNIDIGADVLASVRYLRERIERVKKLGRSIPAREQLIRIQRTSLQLLEDTEMSFLPHEDLWTLVQDARKNIAQWLDTFFTDLNGPTVSATVARWKKTVERLQTVLIPWDGPRRVLCKLAEEISEFDRFTGVIASLRNPALKEKHWLEMSKLVGLTLQDITGLTLRQTMELDLELVQDILAEISREASSELAVETQLQDLFAELSTHSFIVSPYVTEDLSTISNFPSAVAVFDDLLVRSTKLAASTSDAEGPIATRLDAWIKRLQHAQSTLDAWQSLQEFFVRLYPLLALAGDSTHLRREQQENFNAITKIVNILTDVLAKNTRFSVLLLRADLHEMITGAKGRVDVVFEGVARLMDAKRVSFPRFYFLTNEQILEMYAALPDVKKLDPLLKLCFDGVQSLELVEEPNDNAYSLKDPSSTRSSVTRSSVAQSQSALDRSSPLTAETPVSAKAHFQLSKSCDIRIVAVTSLDGQTLQLNAPVLVTPALEEWLGRLESELRSTLKASLIAAAPPDTRKFVIRPAIAALPAQVVTLAGHVIWSRTLSHRPHEPGSPIPKHMAVSLTECMALLQTELSPARRIAVEQLITVLLYTMETLRLPPEDASSRFRCSLVDGNLDLHIMNHTIPYGYEFGNTPRLPSGTESNRAMGYMVNMLKFSACPVLSGHDSAATLRDLASITGTRCIMLDCASTWHPGALGRTLCGLLATGAWLCFANLNATDLSIVNTISHQVGITSRAHNAAVKSRIQTLSHEGRDFPVMKTAAVFATCSHFTGAKQADLPVTFRQLFRPIELGSPDPRAILQTALQIRGYHNAAVLANKVALFLSNASSLLALRGYGFGSLRSFVHMAGALKTATPTAKPSTEADLVVEACNHAWAPQLRANDVDIFNELLRLVFDRANRPVRHVEFQATIDDEAQKLGLGVNPYLVTKMLEIYDGLCTGEKVVIVGDAMSGKTCALRILRAALKALNPSSEIQMKHVHFSAVSDNQLMGAVASATGLLAQGILPRLIREAAHNFANNEPAGSSWIVLDGCVTPLLLQNLDALEAGTTSYTSTGDAHHISPWTRLIVETDSLATINPGMLAGLHIVYMDAEASPVSDHKQMLDLGLTQRLSEYKEYHSILRIAQHIFLLPLLDFRKQHFQRSSTGVPAVMSNAVITSNAFTLFACLVDEETRQNFQRFTIAEQRCWILATYLFALIWIVGSFPDKFTRAAFDTYVRTTLLDGANLAALSAVGVGADSLRPLLDWRGMTIYDCYFDPRLFVWTPWSRLSTERDVAVEQVDRSADFTPTADATRIAYFVQLLVPRGYRPMIVGKPNTGKTVSMANALNARNLPQYTGQAIRLSHAVERSAQAFHALIRSGLVEKRKGTFGCLTGKQAILFVDDVNQFAYDSAGQKIAAELTRALLEGSGWYSGNEWVGIEDLCMVAAYTSRTEAESLAPARLLRHFIALAIDDDVHAKSVEILLPVLSDQLLDTAGPTSLAVNLITATSKFLQLLQNRFRPTTVNPQYRFGLGNAINVLKTVLETPDKSLCTNVISVWGDAIHRNFRDALAAIDFPIYDAEFKTLVATEFPGIRYTEVFVGDEHPVYVPDQSNIRYWTPVANFSAYCGDVSAKTMSADAKLGRASYPDAVRTALSICHNIRMGRPSLLLGGAVFGGTLHAQLAAFILGYTYATYEGEVTMRAKVVSTLRAAITTWKPAVLALSFASDISYADIMSYIKRGAAAFIEELLDDTLVRALHAKAKNENAPELVTRADLLCALLDHARTHLHIVVAAGSDNVGTCWIRDADFAAFVQTCACICLPAPSVAMISHLLAMRIPKGLQLPHADSIARILQKMSESDVSGGCLLTTVASLCDLYLQKHQTLQEQMTEVKVAIKKVKAAFRLIDEAEESYKTWTTRVEETNKHTSDFTKSLEDERDNLEKLKIEVSRDAVILIKLRDQLKEVRDEINAALKAVEPTYHAARVAAEGLSKAELYEVKSMMNPSPAIMLLAETLVTLLRFEVRPQETLWDATQRLFSDRIHTLIANVDTTAISTEQAICAQKCIESEEASPAVLYRTSRPLGVLSEWIQAVTSYHSATIQLQPQRQLAETLQRRINDKERAVTQGKAQQTALELKLSGMRLLYDGKIKHKDSVIAQHKAAERKNTEMSALRGTLTVIRDLCVAEADEMSLKNNGLITEAVLAAGSIGYSSGCSEEMRRSRIDSWLIMLAQEGLPTRRLQQGAFSLCNFICNDKIADLFVSWGLLPDRLTCDNAFIAKNTVRHPIVADPHFRFEQWLRVSERARTVTVVDALDITEFLEDALIKTMRQGTPLLVKLRTAHMNPSLWSTVSRHSESSGMRFVTRKGEQIVANDGFRLYFVLHQSATVLPEAWRHCFHLINNEIQQSTMKEYVIDAISESGHRNLKQEHRAVIQDSNSRKTTGLSLSRKAKEFVKDMDLADSEFFGSQLCANILTMEEQLQAVKNIPPSVRETYEELQVQMNWLAEIAESTAKLCYIAIRTTMITEDMKVCFDSILDACRSCLSRIPVENSTDFIIARRELVKSLVTALGADGATPESRLLLGVLLAHELASCEGDANAGFVITSEQLHFILKGAEPSGIADKIPRNPASQWLSDSHWQKIVSLGTANPLFKRERLVADFARFANRTPSNSGGANDSFEDVFRASEPWKASFPAKWNTCLTFADRLLLISCIRPDIIGRGLEDYCAKILGDRILDGDASAPIDKWEVEKPTVPLLHLDARCDDPALLIRSMVGKKNHNLTTLALGVDLPLKTMTDLLEQAMEKGRWVLVYADYATLEQWSALESVFSQPERCHKQFRVWICSASSSYIPPKLEQRSVKLSDGYEIKRRLQVCRAVLDEHSNPYEFKHHTVYREVLLKLVYFHCVIYLRLALSWSDFNVDLREEQGNLAYAVRMLRSTFARAKNERSAAKKVAGIVDAIYGCQLWRSADRDLMNIIFSEVMNSELQAGTPTLTSIRPMYDAVQKGDVVAYALAVRNIPSSTFATVQATILGPVATAYSNIDRSNRVLELLRTYNGIEKAISRPRSDLADLTNAVLGRLVQTTSSTILDPNADHSVADAEFGSASARSGVDNLLADNVRCYRHFLKHLIRELKRLSAQLCNQAEPDLGCERVLESLRKGRVPSSWKLEHRYPASTLHLDAWIENLVARLSYVKHWYSLRLGDVDHPARDMIVHDISKVWAPQALLQVLLNGPSPSFRETESPGQLEGLVVSAKQSSLPDVGGYVSGLHLVGAAWDKGLPGLRDPRPGDLYAEIPCFWVQPSSRANISMSSKRNVFKVQCPVYVYKPQVDEDPDSQIPLAELCAGNIELPAEFPRSIIRNGAFLSCQVPTER